MALDYFSSVSGVTPGTLSPKVAEATAKKSAPEAPFQKFLDMAVTALEDVSQMEFQTNQLINDYVAGKATMQDVMTQTAKMNIAVQLAVTVTTSTVTAFKEITQMPV